MNQLIELFKEHGIKSGNSLKLIEERLRETSDIKEIREFLNFIGNDKNDITPLTPTEIWNITSEIHAEVAHRCKTTMVLDLFKRYENRRAGFTTSFVSDVERMCSESNGCYGKIEFSKDSRDYLFSKKDTWPFFDQSSSGFTETFKKFCKAIKEAKEYDIEIRGEMILSPLFRLASNEISIGIGMVEDYMEADENDEEFTEVTEYMELLEEHIGNLDDAAVLSVVDVNTTRDIGDIKHIFEGLMREVQEAKDAFNKHKEISKSLNVPESVAWHKYAKDIHELCRIISKQPNKSITYGQLKKQNKQLAESLNSRREFKEEFGSTTKPFTVEDVREWEEGLRLQEFPIVTDKWDSNLQRSVKGQKNPQFVLCVIASPEMLEEMRYVGCYDMFHNHQYKTHPHAGGKDQLGWIRLEIDKDNKELLVDEVQSDYQEVTDDYIKRNPQKITQKSDKEQFANVVDNLIHSNQKFVDYLLTDRIVELGKEMYGDDFEKSFFNVTDEETAKKLIAKYFEVRHKVDIEDHKKEKSYWSPEKLLKEKQALALENIMKDFPHIAAHIVTQFAKANGLEHIYWHTKKNGDSLKGSNAPVVTYTDIPEQNYFKVTEKGPFNLTGPFYKREARLRLLKIARKLLQ
jgi:hypothetical protein